MKFKGEITSVSGKNTLSGDKVYKIIFTTHEPMAMDLGKLKQGTPFTAEYEVDEGR